MDESIELKLIGITYNQIESGVYALILEDPVMARRLPIVIGYPEAQSIECRLQNVKTPRPLSHDLMASIINQLGAKLIRVDIHRLPGGPYAGKLTVENVFGQICEIDARSSDAIALAIRVGAPIFTSKQLLEKEGYSPKDTDKVKGKAAPQSTSSKNAVTSNYSRFSMKQLEELLVKKVEEENYEEASKIKQEIDRRNNENA